MPLVLLEKHAEYAVITLNRPDDMNALSRALRAELVDAFGACQADPSIRVVILTGKGRAFCAGFDLKELGSGNSDNAAEEVNNAVAEAMAAFEGPIIGAINGHAITGGFEMALACDVLLASEDARFADTHARVGMLPGWGLSQKLPRLIGLPRAREMAFTGTAISARQAYEWGLVNHVYPGADLIAEATAMAQQMCACVPDVLRAYKRLIEDGYSMAYQDALKWEEAQAIESAKIATAALVEQRRQGVLSQGRSEND